MHFVILTIAFIAGFPLYRAMGDVSSFRILAPPFVCPKDENSIIDHPDNTVITLQADEIVDWNFTWTVRWYPLTAPTQRFTLALWRTVHKLERQLNGPHAEPGVYIINNSDLLSGVKYIFNVTTSLPDSEDNIEKSFFIDNIKNDHKLLLEGRSNMFSIVLVGGQLTYSDLSYVLEAQVTTCHKTQDYYFVWSASSGDNSVDVSDVKGSILEIKAYSLMPGLTYNMQCKLFKKSNGEFIIENRLSINVLHRDFIVNFNIDVLVITVGTPFKVQTNIKELDYLQNELEITWECFINDEQFEDFEINEGSAVIFPSGLPTVGKYLLSVTVTVLGKIWTADSSVCLKAVEDQLPVIEVDPTPRVVNKDSIINLNANVSNVSPGCTISWYFIYDDCLLSKISPLDNCTGSGHGTPISDPIHFNSLEDNFLSELADYSNETSWKSVTAELQAATGTARLIAKCEGNKIVNYTTKGTVYADVKLTINEKPDAGNVLIIPETGTAMETMFRISTLAVVDPNRPLRYTFYCELRNNDFLVLGTYLENLAVETLLPYIDEGTPLWVEVCDSLGACSFGPQSLVELAPGEARTLAALIEEMQALVMRCEIMLFRRLASFAIITYINVNQTDENLKFTTALLENLRGIELNCTERYYEQYNNFLYWLTNIGVDTSEFL